ncbi:alpha/beta fold hydrolase [Salinarimonas sp.]|uniref:thioesterase II family protein n=1 Tax=Salinarimonas sp. TaxID=2766526 RepID=UPI0032D8CEFC
MTLFNELFCEKGRCAPRARLVCFPHAGGTSDAFQPFRARLDPDVELLVARYPHEAGAGQADAIPSLAASLADALGALEPAPTAFFGHSLGALLAFEVARRLGEAHTPARLFLSGCREPSLVPSPFVRRAVTLPDADFVEAVAELGGLPEDALADADVRAYLAAMLRADFALVASYRLAPEPILDVPFTLLAGAEDMHVPIDSVRGWERVTRAPVRMQVFQGGHFFPFLTENCPTIVAEIEGCFADDALSLTI